MFLCTLTLHRQLLKLANEQSLYLIEDHKFMVSGSKTLAELHQGKKGYLCIAYSSREVATV